MSIFGNATAVSEREAKNKIYGVVIGIVTSNTDESENTYRVRVRFPWLDGGGEKEYDSAKKEEKETHQSYWARIASFSAGEFLSGESKGPRGAFFLPEIDDEVLVAFEHGDMSRPIVIGRMWSDVSPDKKSQGGDDGKPNRPTYAHTNKKGELATTIDEKRPAAIKGYDNLDHEEKKNDLSGFRSRLGHTLVFDDNKKKPGIVLCSSKGHRIELLDNEKADQNQGILLADPDGNYVWLKSGKAKGDIEIYTAGNLHLIAEKDVNIISKKGNINVVADKGNALLQTKNGTFDIKSHGNLSIKTEAAGTISGKTLALSGKPLNLN